MKYKCKHCGDDFTVNSETQRLFEDSEIERPEICWTCVHLLNNPIEPEEFSDADNGL